MSDNQIFEELKEGLAIDLAKLHFAAQGQATLAEQAGELAAEAKAVAKQRKMDLEEITSNITKDVMMHPENHGLAKTTEAAIKAAVVTHPESLSARVALIEAEREADRASAIEMAFQHRKSMIQCEVRLFVSNYWGDPEVMEDEMSEASKLTVDQLQDRIAEKRKNLDNSE